MSELSKAGISDPVIADSYRRCKKLNSQHGKTYFLATLLLPPSKRPFVHALYGFARYADEIVDDLASTLTDQEKAVALEGWGKQVLSDIKNGKSEDPIGRALVDTVNRFDIPITYFESFLNSMSMDLTVDEYETFDDLMEYVYGSAVVIGLQMLPILGPLSPDAKSAAEKLGAAFQLANFIRDIGEDLERGRIYIPISELALFDVTREDLYERKITPNIIAAIKFQINRVRELQKEANEGILFLDETSRPCIEAASELYCGIVDEVEAIGYDVFNFRAKTSQWRRMKVAFPAYLRAVNARRN